MHAHKVREPRVAGAHAALVLVRDDRARRRVVEAGPPGRRHPPEGLSCDPVVRDTPACVRWAAPQKSRFSCGLFLLVPLKGKLYPG